MGQAKSIQSCSLLFFIICRGPELLWGEAWWLPERVDFDTINVSRFFKRQQAMKPLFNNAFVCLYQGRAGMHRFLGTYLGTSRGYSTMRQVNWQLWVEDEGCGKLGRALAPHGCLLSPSAHHTASVFILGLDPLFISLYFRVNKVVVRKGALPREGTLTVMEMCHTIWSSEAGFFKENKKRSRVFFITFLSQ